MSDAHDTVTVTWSQPEAAVIVSFLAWHGIPAYALGHHSAVEPPLVTALGGIAVRVPSDLAGEARALLAEVEEPPVIRPPIVPRPLLDRVIAVACFLFGATPPPRVGSARE